MTKKKHHKKIKQVPCTDVHQHVREHNERVMKQRAWEAKKREEKLRELQEQMEKQRLDTSSKS